MLELQYMPKWLGNSSSLKNSTILPNNLTCLLLVFYIFTFPSYAYILNFTHRELTQHQRNTKVDSSGLKPPTDHDHFASVFFTPFNIFINHIAFMMKSTDGTVNVK